MVRLKYWQAINAAMAEEMERASITTWSSRPRLSAKSSSFNRLVWIRPADFVLPLQQIATSQKLWWTSSPNCVSLPPLDRWSGSERANDNYGFALEAQPGKSQRRPIGGPGADGSRGQFHAGSVKPRPGPP